MLALCALLLLLCGTFGTFTSAQFVSAPPASAFTYTTGYAGVAVKYRAVPTGTCETRANIKSYSGYAEVQPGEWLFFWFFETRNGDPTKAPLTAWINGGPGSSSMIGLFQELGPCGIDKDGKVYDNPFAWNEVSNMLFVDQPISTGFSYTKPVPGYKSKSGNIVTLPSPHCPDYARDLDCGTYSSPNVSTTVNSTDGAAPGFYRLLQGFMGAFPQYSRNEFHFTTESYGGHYAPILSDYIEQQNDLALPGTHKVKLGSVAIGNGWFDPRIQYEAYYKYALNGYYDINPYNASILAQVHNNVYGAGNCLDQIDDCKRTGLNEVCSVADSFCASEVESFLDNIANRDEYDVRELQPDPFPYSFYVDYLNTPKVQKAIGAYVNFTESSPTTGNAFATTGDDARDKGTIEAVRRLLAKGVYVTLYFGDADYNCNIFGGMEIADKINHKGYAEAGYTNITTSDGIVHGQVRQAGRFSFARIFYSGHEAPFYQPLATLEMFKRIISRKDIATGKQAISAFYRTLGPKESTFREGNATVQHEVLPDDATYNTTTHQPNPYKKANDTAAQSGSKGNQRAFSLGFLAASKDGQRGSRLKIKNLARQHRPRRVRQ